LFEVRHVSLVGDKYTVNIESQECSYRKWLISGIPCCHAIATMNFLNLKAEDYIPYWFRHTTYKEIYNSIVLPVNGHLLWETTAFPDVLPPRKRRLPKRPTKKRRVEAWELKKDKTQMSQVAIERDVQFVTHLGTKGIIVQHFLYMDVKNIPLKLQHHNQLNQH